MREKICAHRRMYNNQPFEPVTIAHPAAKRWLITAMVENGLEPVVTKHGEGVVTIGVAGELCPLCRRAM